MSKKHRQGQFKIVDSFAIRRRNEFYLIGQIIEGVVQEGWFVNIPFNEAMIMTLRMSIIEDIEVSGDNGEYKLLIVSGLDKQDGVDLLLGLNIGNEYVDITIEGED